MISQLIAVTCLLCLHDQMFVGATEMILQEGSAVYNTSIEYDPLTADVPSTTREMGWSFARPQR